MINPFMPPAEWGLRWLFHQPEVTVVLSGMNSIDMVEENCRIVSDAQAGELTASDFAALEKIKRAIQEREKIAGQRVRCGKCEQHCPQSIPIREKLKEADKAPRPLPYRIGISAARKYMFRKTKA